MAQIYSNTWSVGSSGYGSGSFTYRIRVDESNNNITNNTHAITVYFDIIGVKSYYNSMSPTSNTFTITHNGTNPSSPINANSNISGAKSTNYSSWTQIGSWSGTVTGNNDGTLTLNISITYGNNNYNYMPTVTTISTGTINATTLPRASEVSLGSSSITISSTSGSLSYSITAKSNSFYNKLVWSVAGSADTEVQKSTGSSTGSISYSDIINKMPSASSGRLLAVVKTYSDSGYSNLIGTSSEASCDITLNTSQSVFKPTVTLGNIAINTTPTNISVAVAGYSTLKATFNSSAGSGSTIDAVYFTSSNGSLNMSASTSSSGTITSKTLPTSSSDYTFTLNAYAIDKRGSVSNTVTKTYTVKGYAPPALTFKAYRVAANVSSSPYPQDNAGGYVWVSFTNTISLTSSGNAVTSATCKYKRSTDSSWTTLSTNPTGTNASSNPNPTLATTSSMTVTYTVQDRISSNEVTINVGTARYAFDLYDDKSNVGVGLGTTAESGKVKIGSLPLDDTSGRVTVGVSTQSTLPSSSIGVHDVRSVTLTPTHGSKGANFYFFGNADSTNTRPSTSSTWWSLLHVKGWDGSYGAWEIAGNATNNDTAKTTPLYVRGGLNTSWGSWRQIYDSGNKSDILKLVYPVGSIYISTSSTNPGNASVFGFGTWEPRKRAARNGRNPIVRFKHLMQRHKAENILIL